MTTGIKMPDGTTCYSGPDCKKHGFLNQLQRRISKLDTSESICYMYQPSNLPDAKPSTRKRVTGDNKDPNVKSPILEQLDSESRYMETVLTKDEIRNLQYYVVSYEYLNEDLRHGDKGILSYLNTFSKGTWSDINETLKKYKNMSKQRIEEMDSVFKKYKRPENNLRTLYRKVTTNDLSQYKIGDTYEDKGYMSTSVDPDSVLAHTSNGDNKHTVVYEILSRNGVPLHKHSSSPAFAGYAEREVLLNRGSKFTITNIREATFVSSYPEKRPSKHFIYDNAKPRETYTVITMIEQ